EAKRDVVWKPNFRLYPVLFTVVDRRGIILRRGAAVRSRRVGPTRAGCDYIFLGWRFQRRVDTRRQRRAAQGPAAQNRPASWRKTARSGHAVGRKMRIRAAPSITRAAILMRRSLSVANSAEESGEHLAIPSRMLSMSQ